ncbi:MAG: methionyl-tRNA formyltransferase [Rhodospirillales bacterium]|nr:methionyl-tRNA formyltransferase [Rhodospirillales bacterium]
MRLVFMGTPEFAVPALTGLAAAGHEIACVYTQPPRPAGRGHKEQRSAVHEAALARGIAVRTPASLKGAAEQGAFAALAADVAVVAAYGLILPRAILVAPRLGCLSITIMQMDEGLDTGAMLLQACVPIRSDTTAAMLHDWLAALGGECIVRALRGLAAGELAPTPQPADGVTYAAKLTREEARLDWRRPAAELERQVRAFDPWPGAFCEYKGERIKVLQAAVDGAAAGVPGTALDDRLAIACGTGALRLLRVQRPGRAAMDAAEFLRGHPVPAGTAFS